MMHKKMIITICSFLVLSVVVASHAVRAGISERTYFGGGYAASGQINDAGYVTQLYDATNGLPTSDANYILGSSDGFIWVEDTAEYCVMTAIPLQGSTRLTA